MRAQDAHVALLIFPTVAAGGWAVDIELGGELILVAHFAGVICKVPGHLPGSGIDREAASLGPVQSFPRDVFIDIKPVAAFYRAIQGRALAHFIRECDEQRLAVYARQNETSACRVVHRV